MAECMLDLLSKKGVIIIEVQYLLNTIKDLTFDNIYHEHYNYWSLTSLTYFFNKLGAIIFKVEKINPHGGSIRVYISKNKSIKKQSFKSKNCRIWIASKSHYGFKFFWNFKRNRFYY